MLGTRKRERKARRRTRTSGDSRKLAENWREDWNKLLEPEVKKN